MEKMYASSSVINFTKRNFNRKKFLNRTCLIVLAFCTFGLVNNTYAQTTIYSTDFGAVANVNPVGWTFTGVDMTISTNTASSGYTGASGGAYLGEGNSTAFTNTFGTPFSASQIGTSTATLQLSSSGFDIITVGFGMRKSSASYNTNATYFFEWSTDGTTFTPITYTEATAGSWGLASGAGLTLPAAAGNQPTLFLKWTFNRTGTGSNIKFDDVNVTGINALPPANLVFTVDNQTVNESAGTISANIAIASSNVNPSSVDVVIIPFGTASVGSDITYSTTTITFPGSATGTLPVTITLNEDLLPEPSEYFVIRLQNPVNATITGITQHTVFIKDNENSTPVGTNEVTMSFVSSFSNGAAGTNSSEIVAHDPISQRLFLANSIGRKLDIVDFSNPAAMSMLFSIDISSYGNINSVAVKNGIIACAIENITPELDGFVVFFDTNGVFQKQVIVGAMPDMITFNNAGTRVLTANEGQPNDAYTIDPEGSVSIIDISGGIPALLQSNVTTALFTSFNGQMATLKASGVRIFGPGATVSQDMEPEYIALSEDDQTAYVALQENNAFAYINMTTNTITDIKPLGFKDYSLINNGIDATNNGSNVNIANWPIKGVYMPDAMTRFNIGASEYLITANEGDARAYTGLNEETTIGNASYILDPTAFPYASVMKSNANLGRLKCTNQLGDTDSDGDFDEIYSYGARSFSIWNATTGTLVYDSGDDMEQITANDPTYGGMFNCSNTNITKKDRSDDKGPEPEGVTVATIAGNVYAFVSMERVGGLMVFNINNPAAPVFSQYVNNRGLTGLTGDRGPEGTIYISQQNSPTGKALIVLGNEVSSTTSVYEIACPLATAVNTASGATTVCDGNTVALTSSTLTGATYAWYNGASLIAGATSSSYTATVSGNYSVQLNNVGCAVPSNTIAVTVNPLPSTTVSAGGTTTFCAGGSVMFSTAAGNTYQWQLNGTPISGANAANYTANASGNYSVIITNASSCSATSSVQTVVVNPLPNAAYTAGGSTSVCDGDSVVFTANTGLTYQWYYNGTPISGATSINYSALNQGNYSVMVSNGSCSATSANTYVTIYSLPATPLISQSGSMLTSTFATTYQWYLNGTPISGANSQTYAITANGTYSVVTTNSVGCESASAPWVVTTTDIASIQSVGEVNVYPNPYSEFTTIQINVLENANVLAEVYNVLGEKIQTIVNAELSTGNYNYNFGAKQLGYTSGIYFVKITINSKVSVIKIIESN